ncbi:TPA: ATP-binding cassette domain-containing protein [Escherichia coli]|nr:ATP-binding cassette domain-containing protein [Escherichia coli]
MTQKNFVELRNVTKRFGSNTVIDNINLTIPQGQMVTLLGPSGCGKTTILRLVAGLEKPSEGQIFIDGEDVTHRSIQQRDICMVFQSYALFPHMSLGENVGYVDIYGYHLPRPLHFGTQGEGMVGVRPEAITLSDRGEESQRCVIRHVAYMGPQYEVTVEWHGQEILLQVNATRLQPDVGEQYYLEIHPYGMFVLADAA